MNPSSLFSVSMPETLSLKAVALNLLLSALLSSILGMYYTRYGRSLSNRGSLAIVFTLVALTTTLIISVVKSSLALSLGLVGALSIVRFRAAIKEPEELAYLFLTIAIGLGFGADQRAPTILAFVMILFFVHLRHYAVKTKAPANLYLEWAAAGELPADMADRVIGTTAEYASTVDLKRLDQGDGSLQVSFLVTLSEGQHISELVNALTALAPGARATFVDQSRIFDA